MPDLVSNKSIDSIKLFKLGTWQITLDAQTKSVLPINFESFNIFLVLKNSLIVGMLFFWALSATFLDGSNPITFFLSEKLFKKVPSLEPISITLELELR